MSVVRNTEQAHQCHIWAERRFDTITWGPVVRRCLRLCPPSPSPHIWSMFCVQEEAFGLFNLSSLSLSSAQAPITYAGFYFKRDSLLILVPLPTFLQQEIPPAAVLALQTQMYFINAISQGKRFKNTCQTFVYLYEKFQGFSQLDLRHITNPVSV